MKITILHGMDAMRLLLDMNPIRDVRFRGTWYRLKITGSGFVLIEESNSSSKEPIIAGIYQDTKSEIGSTDSIIDIISCITAPLRMMQIDVEVQLNGVQRDWVEYCTSIDDLRRSAGCLNRLTSTIDDVLIGDVTQYELEMVWPESIAIHGVPTELMEQVPISVSEKNVVIINGEKYFLYNGVVLKDHGDCVILLRRFDRYGLSVMTIDHDKAHQLFREAVK